MPNVTVHMDGDGCWPDLKTTPFLHGAVQEAAYLEGGMESGNPSVSLRIKLDSGTIVLAEISLQMFMTLAASFHGRALRDGIDCWRVPLGSEIDRLQQALTAVLLFYVVDFDAATKARWIELTGKQEASTKSLCDFIRGVIGMKE